MLLIRSFDFLTIPTFNTINMTWMGFLAPFVSLFSLTFVSNAVIAYYYYDFGFFLNIAPVINEEGNDDKERFLQLLATSNGVMRLVDVLQVINPINVR